MIPVWWLTWEPDTIARGYWDQGALEDLFSGAAWQPPNAHEFGHSEGMEVVGTAQTGKAGAVVVVPGRHNAKHIDRLDGVIRHLDWVLLIVTGDEEGVFRLADVKHPNLRAWVMTGRPQIDEGARRFLGSGYPPWYRDALPKSTPTKQVPVAFSGQVTHARRHDCTDAMQHIPEAESVETEGFTQGLERGEYARFMARSKIAPCPSGPVSPDSFRFYEALEAGTLPIADGQTPAGDGDGYWSSLFGTSALPFPIIDDWSTLPALTEELLADWPTNVNQASTWWADHKRGLAYQLHRDIAELSGITREPTYPSDPNDLITVVIPTSPAPLHPDTSALVKVIDSVRERLPHAEIIVCADGVRPEQEDRRNDYDEYLRRVSWITSHRMHNVLLTIAPEWGHQALTVRRALDKVTTPLMLFMEHDTLLVQDINWQACAFMLEGPAEVIRFHHESQVLDVHQHLMLDRKEPGGSAFLRTVQWSQRPHLARTDFYRRLLDTYFTDESRTMIEDTMHGIVHNAWREYGLAGWDRFRVWLYAPDTPSIQRSTHLDTRGSASKYEMRP